MWVMIVTICKDTFAESSLNLGQTQEELLQRWRSFQFDETTGIIDSYVLRMLGYNERQVLKLFKYI